MKNRFQPASAEIMPAREAVWRAQGIAHEAKAGDRLRTILNRAMDLFNQLVSPLGLWEPVSTSEFAKIYLGEGLNREPTPIGTIYPRADALALFVFTLGAAVSEQIKNLFEKNDFALGAMLDSIASESADLAARQAEGMWLDTLGRAGNGTAPERVLLYSPGYCGWHISAQKKLFHRLQPEQIAVTLNKSYLMTPLKSISGVLVAGKRRLHRLDSAVPGCSDCAARLCRHGLQPKNKPVEEEVHADT